MYHLVKIYMTFRTHNVKRKRNLNKEDCDLVILNIRLRIIENIFNTVEVVFLSGCFIQDITVPPFMHVLPIPYVLANKKHFIVISWSEI